MGLWVVLEATMLLGWKGVEWGPVRAMGTSGRTEMVSSSRRVGKAGSLMSPRTQQRGVRSRARHRSVSRGRGNRRLVA